MYLILNRRVTHGCPCIVKASRSRDARGSERCENTELPGFPLRPGSPAPRPAAVPGGPALPLGLRWAPVCPTCPSAVATWWAGLSLSWQSLSAPGDLSFRYSLLPGRASTSGHIPTWNLIYLDSLHVQSFDSFDKSMFLFIFSEFSDCYMIQGVFVLAYLPFNWKWNYVSFVRQATSLNFY